MPPTICSIHGRSGSELVCPHTAEVVRIGKPIPANLVEDKRLFGAAAWFCAACETQLVAGRGEVYRSLDIMNGDTDDEDALADVVLDDLVPLCGRCFREWHETSQPHD